MSADIDAEVAEAARTIALYRGRGHAEASDFRAVAKAHARRLVEADVFVSRLAYLGDKAAQAYAEHHGHDWKHDSNALGAGVLPLADTERARLTRFGALAHELRSYFNSGLIAKETDLFLLLQEVAPTPEDQDLISALRGGRTGDLLDDAADAAADEIERLRAVLTDAAEDIEHWGGYASPYFQDKWNLQADIAKYRAAAGTTVREDVAL